MEHRLVRWSWPKTQNYLDRSRLILIPIGSTEQHGPNGLLGTDAMCAEEIALGVAAKIDAAVAPTIAVGMSLHHLGFPGTISLRPATLLELVTDYVTSLYRHGFRGFLFVNGHGGNTPAGTAALQGLRDQLPDADLRWMDWFRLPVIEEMGKQLFGDRKGSHASPTEISVTMVACGDAIEPIEGPMDMTVCRPRGIPGAARFREYYPDGRIGSDPSLARREHGEALITAAVDAIAAEARALAAAVAPA